MKRIVIFPTIFLIVPALMVYNNPVQDLIDKVDIFFQRRALERVYLQLSQPYYTNGDIIWYSAYLTDFENNLSKLSEVVHVDLLDPKGKIAQSSSIRVIDGRGYGYMKIGDNLNTGYYRIIAYTNWMRNFDQSLFFNQKIEIISEILGIKEDKDEIMEPKLKLSVEGGVLLEGKNSTISIFRGVDKNDSSSHYQILDAQNNVIKEIKVRNTLTQTFKFTPKKVEEYYLSTNNGLKLTKMPEVMSRGTTLSVEESENELKIISYCSENFNNQSIFYVIQVNGRILYSIEGAYKNNEFVTVVFKSDLPEGIIHLSGFDQNGNLRNERFFYNHVKDQQKVYIRNKKYRPKQKVNLSLNMGESASFSVSVRNEKFFKHHHAAGIKKYLNLSRTSLKSDLITHIKESEINDMLIASEAVGYSWKNVLSMERPNKRFQIEKSQIFEHSGKIVSNSKGRINYSITTNGNESGIFFNTTDENGEFRFTVPSHEGTQKMIINVIPESNDSNFYKIEMNSIRMKKESYLTNLEPTSQQLQYVKQIRENRVINRIYDLDHVYLGPGYKSSNLLLKSFEPDETIKLTEYTPMKNMVEISTELLLGVRIRKNKDNSYRIQMRGVDTDGKFMTFNDVPPLCLIDNIPIYDSKIIGDFNPLNIESINMNYKDFTLNGISHKGILSIETVEGSYGEVNSGNFVVTSSAGFSEKLTLKIIEHSNSNSRIPDFRPLLYWNPNLRTDNNGKVNIEFYSSDDIGNYIIDIQGITDDGELISYQEMITISETP